MHKSKAEVNLDSEVNQQGNYVTTLLFFFFKKGHNNFSFVITNLLPSFLHPAPTHTHADTLFRVCLATHAHLRAF